MVSKQQLFKNATCLAFCFIIIFVTSIFVSQTYFEKIINNQIQEISLLKSVHFQDWAIMEAPSKILHRFQAYTFDNQLNQPKLINQTMMYQYTFEYKNISFSQGNTGNVQYLNCWKRSFIPTQNLNNQQYNLLNIDAQKVYNYDFYAPQTRNFALMYNLLFDTLSKNFIEYFYGYYLHEYFFKTFSNVQKRIFSPLGILQQDGIKIYNDKNYGFSKPQNVALWVKLNSKIISGDYYLQQFYGGIRQNLKLSQKQILFIADSSSTLSNLIVALKGSIKYKLWSRDYDYECEGQFCSNQVLAASQLAFGFLTKQSIFYATNLDKLTNELNTTIYSQIQYSTFCEITPNITCLDNLGSISFFIDNYLSNYTQVDFILKNLDKPELFEDRYQFPEGTGQSISKYVQHLYNNVFNIPSKNGQETFLALKKSFTNYNHFQKILDSSKDLVFIQLHSRGFTNNLGKNKTIKCQDYYSGQFQKYKSDCQIEALNLLNGLQSVRNYVKVYLGYQSYQISQNSKMDKQTLFEFLHNEDKSKFALQMQMLSKQIQIKYDCNQHCTASQLMFKQWKDGSILNNLPEAYFDSKTVSILDWDESNILKGKQPQIYKYVNLTAQYDSEIIFSNLKGIYSLFNLMKVYSQPNGSLYSGITNFDILFYHQNLVLSIGFNGLYTPKQIDRAFNGYDSEIIKYKNKMGDKLGGASWLDSKISLIQLQNNPDKFNSINSGIYDTQKLRTLYNIQNSRYSSSEYIVFKSQYQNVKKNFVTNKKVKGTNLLGFQNKIKQSDNIEGYFDMIHQSQTLVFKQSLKWKDLDQKQISAFKYVFPENLKDITVDVQQQTNRTVTLMPDSYIIVEQQTGLTLSMYIKYKVSSQPFFLQFIKSQQNKKLPLYQGQIIYVNQNTNKILQINKNKDQQSFFFLLGMILSSISTVAFIILMILYIKSKKANKKVTDQKRSLITQNNSITTNILQN